MTLTHRPQLTALVSSSRDCGTRATQMAIDDAIGRVVGIPRMREVIGKPGAVATNPADWSRALAHFEVRHEAAATYQQLETHLRAGHGAILAIHYGTMRQVAPARVGSRTFSAYHGVYLRGFAAATAARPARVRNWDALFDGRYQGCPKGPTMTPLPKLLTAAREVSRREGTSRPFAILTWPAKEPAQGVVLPDQLSLYDVLVDLYELPRPKALAAAIADLEAVLGIVVTEDDGSEPSEGLRLALPARGSGARRAAR